MALAVNSICQRDHGDSRQDYYCPDDLHSSQHLAEEKEREDDGRHGEYIFKSRTRGGGKLSDRIDVGELPGDDADQSRTDSQGDSCCGQIYRYMKQRLTACGNRNLHNEAC